MNNENFHPVLQEPPLAHALQKWDEAKRTLTYEYNGRNIISINIPFGEDIGFRHGSDGNLQSVPLIQQIYVMLDRPVKSRVKLTLSSDSINMKPKRADHEHAVLGQMGRPLLFGINGMYDIRQDLLIDWNGCNWRWISESVTDKGDGTAEVELEVELGQKPWFINLRMHYYRTHLGYRSHTPWKWRPNLKGLAGWCSWEAFRRDVNQENIDEVSDFFAKNLKDYGLEYIQLDDGYEKMPIPAGPEGSLAEGWLCTNSQFPQGHKGVIDSIKARGLEPGIWTNANITNPEFASKHPDCLLKDEEGKHMLGEWIDFLLDCSPESLKEHVAPYYKGLKDMGYTYFKTDAIRHLIYDGLHEAVRQGFMSNSDAEARFRAFMECARENLGDEVYFLASWGVLPEAVGTVDAFRIAMDANPTWAGIRMQLVETARWFHVQRILFLIDSDHICARAKPDWARCICSLVSLSGGLYMLSDPLKDYDEERLDIIRKTLPPLRTVTAETGGLPLDTPAFTWTKLHGFAVPRENPVKTEDINETDALNMAGIYPTMNDSHPFSSLWAFHFNNDFRRWSVIARFGTVPLQACSVRLEELGLDGEAEFAAFDFWKQEYLGHVVKKLDCPALGLGQCQVISLTPVRKQPQLIASSRHVSMDAVSVKGRKWENKVLTVALTGVKGSTQAYWFHCPAGMKFTGLKAEGCRAGCPSEGEIIKAGTGCTADGNAIKVNVTFDNSEAAISLNFV